MATLLTLGVGSSPAIAAGVSHSRLSFSRSQSLAGARTTILSSVTPPSVSMLPSSLYALPLVYCGRGDKKTAKGKRFKHSFGNARPRNKKKGRGPPHGMAPPSPPKKDKFEDGEVVKIEIDESLFN